MLFASGKKDNDFQEIDEFIEARDYNAALALLEEFVQDNPLKFDEAQKRIKKILKTRTEYNVLAEELINVILNEPTNDEKKLNMIAQLESMEKNPNKTNIDFISQTKVASQFTYYRSMFEKYMSDGAALVVQKKYSEAVDTFSQGFELYQADFFELGYGEVIESNVKLALGTIESNILAYKNLQQSLGDAAKKLQVALENADLISSQAAWQSFATQMDLFVTFRNQIASSGWNLTSTFDALKNDYPDLTEASFLPFAYRFTLGRASDPNSGVLGAMDNQWNIIIEELKPLAYEATKNKIDYFSTNITQNNSSFLYSYPVDYAKLNAALSETEQFAQIAISINDLYTKRLSSVQTYSENPFVQYTNSMAYIETVVGQSKELLALTTDFSLLMNEFGNYQPNNAPELEIRNQTKTYLSGMQNYASDFLQVSSNCLDNNQKAKNNYEQIFPENNPSQINWRDTYQSFLTANNVIAGLAKNYSANIWTTLGLYISEGSSVIAQDYKDKYAESLNLFSGNANSSLGAYPSESAGLLENLLSSLPGDKQQLASLQTLFTQVPSDLISSATAPTSLSASSYKIGADIAELTKIQTDSSDLLARAQNQIILAERAKSEAELRYNQALASLNKNEFQVARDTIQRARIKFNESLAFQEDAALRTRSDTILGNLGLEINKAENELVVREVRQMKTQAKNSYYSGNFEQAENLLVQARTRWSTTNVEEDQEITNLLSLVGTALSMKTGRIIPATAPLYPEMSQILSIANQYFNDGQKLISQGNKAEAITILNEAKQKLRDLQLVYPLNQEASLLTLRIDQLIDPESFKTIFKQKIDTAKTDYKVASKQQSAYTELLDLYEMNPAYPGLKDFIYNVEIEIGVRQKPIDQTGIVQSNRLTVEAQKIVDSANRDEIALNQALAKVDEAIKLNPNNETAMILKDRIQTSIGGQAVSVLSSESESLYQKAVQELQKGNTIEASALVSQLLNNKQNQRSAKILDLKKRVESLL